MKLIVGLGNPGDRYRETYHNIGFNALDILAARFSVPELRFDKKSDSLLGDVSVAGQKVMLCKPQTFMNLSGDAVCEIAHYYKLSPKEILILYDDVDIKKGIVRARQNGSAGTHNGMRDIVSKLGSFDFARVRIGTGLKPDFISLVDYVLSKPFPSERKLLDRACAAAAELAEQWAKGEPWQDMTVTVADDG